MKHFILEDNETRIEKFDELKGYGVICETVEEAIQKFKELGPFDVYHLDHDLGGETFVASGERNTGYQFALFLEEQGVTGENETIIIHSWNPVGAKLMAKCFKASHIMPFPEVFNSALLKELEIEEK